MQLYEHILKLLGKDRNEAIFLSFLETVDEQPLIDDDGIIAQYSFCRSGFRLFYVEPFGCFCMASFSINDASNEEEASRPYKGTFSNGIEVGDNRNQVQRKLGVLPTSTTQETPCKSQLCAKAEIVSDCYELGLFEVIFSFDAPTSELKSVSVKYPQARVQTSPTK
jgi:hypothetical protein